MADLPQMPDVAAQAPEAPEAQAPQQAEVVDIDGLSEFSFQGEKRDHAWLHKTVNEHQTYAKQVEEYKKEVEFANNLQIDLDNVLSDPRLASKFKAVYPQKYHAILDRFLATNGQAPAQANNAQSFSLPKEFQQEFSQMKERLQFHEQRSYQAEVQASSAKLDSMLPPIFAKYDMANEDQVYAKAEALLQTGQKLTEKTWERLARESHVAQEKKFDQRQAALLKKQEDAANKGKDVGPGGTVPGAAPLKIRTFAEAQEAAIASMSKKIG